ncbi:MAG: helix-hairpin-helix domain-containing protein [Prolixibacteraceae bacterium]|nr:helix-hairpin-helix domain-containing protein [Prolixibacteraceae bacterium]
MKLLSLCFLLLFVYKFSFTQTQNTALTNEITERIAETYIGVSEENNDMESVIDNLEKIAENPINLNTATKKELEDLNLLTAYQIENLLIYRNNVGNIYSVFELIGIDGFNAILINDLMNFIYAGDITPIEKDFSKNEINIRTQYTLEKSKGFEEKEFKGIRPKLFLKYNYQKGEKFSGGITAENDSGEEFFKGSNSRGFDFYSGHLCWNGRNIIKRIIVGDYQVKLGQGATMWAGYGKRKSAESISLRFDGQGIRPFTSSDENLFLRGGAVLFEKGNYNMLLFISEKNIDANISETDSSGNYIKVSSLKTSGYHRTDSEIYDEKKLNSFTTGFSAVISKSKFKAGLNFVYQKFNLPIEPEEKLYNKFKFRGDNNFNISTDALIISKRTNFFGEAAISKSGGLALIAGMESNPSSEIGLSLLFRSYSKEFHTICGNSISESGLNNEAGILTNFIWTPIPHSKLSGYIDFYKSYWPEYNVSNLSSGTDLVINGEYAINSYSKFSMRFKEEISNKSSKEEQSAIKKDINTTSQKIRLQYSWSPNGSISLNLRGEISSYNKNNSISSGWLIMSNIKTSFLKNKLVTTASASFFNTEDYDSRIYTYENDIPSNNYIPAFQNKGIRLYMNLKYKISNNFTIYLKAGTTQYLDDIIKTGTGLNEINSNHKTDIKLQLRIRL